VESNAIAKGLTFQVLQSRLIQSLRSKLDNGEFTERGLSRLTGISQPQVHNLLKGARKLSPESADLLLAAAHLSVIDLLDSSEIEAIDASPAHVRPIPQTVTDDPHHQLSLFTEPETCPRKNPSSFLPSLFALQEQAS
jgi:transcriptional regulator with XRE-family HTH domain